MTKPLGPSFEPDLAEFMSLVKRDIGLSINCIQIGTIETFNATLGTASATINFKRQLADESVVDYPVLADCPVFTLNGGGASLTFPISKGDTCIILFNDRNIDNWYLSGKVDVPRDTRIHNISDGIILVGIRSINNAIITPIGSACLDAGTKKVAIKNDLTDLKTLILSLIDAITAMTQTVAGGGGGTTVSPPVNAATFATLKTQFSSLLDEGIS